MSELLDLSKKKKFMEKTNSWTRDELQEHLFVALMKIDELQKREEHFRAELKTRNAQLAKAKRENDDE